MEKDYRHATIDELMDVLESARSLSIEVREEIREEVRRRNRIAILKRAAEELKGLKK